LCAGASDRDEREGCDEQERASICGRPHVVNVRKKNEARQ